MPKMLYGGMDEAFIIVSVITSLFGILGLLILDRNWFRRERFKFEQDTQKKEYALRFKKMARDMGLDTKVNTPPYRSPAASPMDNIAPLLGLAKNLNPEQLGAIAEVLGGTGGGGGDEAPEGLPGGLDGLLEFATKNPDLVKGFLEGITKGKTGGGSDGGFI
jgi:hypothetical protein